MLPRLKAGARVVQRAEARALVHRLDKDVLQQIVGGIGVSHAIPQVATQLVFVSLSGDSHAGERNRWGRLVAVHPIHRCIVVTLHRVRISLLVLPR
jgi:hypothetical protein